MRLPAAMVQRAADVLIDMDPKYATSEEIARAMLEAARPSDKPTPDEQKGMFRSRGETLLDDCIYLMEQMFMESLNGVLCQVDDADDGRSGACARCERMWDDLKALMARYDAGER
jgi:hypothetical protein